MPLHESIDGARCEALATRISAGDEAAWKTLVEHLWPPLRAFVARSRSMGRFKRSEDDVNDVLAEVVGRLGGPGGRGLSLYPPWRARHPDKTFEDWLQIVTVNEIRRHVRRQLACHVESGAQRLPSVARVLNELMTSPAVEELGIRPPITAAQTAQQLLVFARAELPADRFRALGLWLDGAGFDEIAGELDLGEPALAQRLVRAALAVLRRRFAPGAGQP